MKELEIYNELKLVLSRVKIGHETEILNIVRAELVDRLNKAFDIIKELGSENMLDELDKIADAIDELNK